MPIVEIKGIPPVNQGPVQEVFDYEEEWDDDEFIDSSDYGELDYLSIPNSMRVRHVTEVARRF